MLQATMGGAEAGTKYKAFLRSATKGGEALGLKFTDANNQLLSMPEILDILRGKFGETMDAAEKMELQKAFGDTEAVALIDLMYNKVGDLQDNIVNMYGSLGKGVSVTEQMASAIRFRRETLLRLLAAQRQRPLAGPYYGAVLAALEEGISFPAAWRQGFAALSGEGGRILRRLEPEGDEQRILGELTWAAGELTELRRGLEQESRQREKLWFAGLFSGAGLLLILLI